MKNPLLLLSKKISDPSLTIIKENEKKKNRWNLDVKIETDGNIWQVQINNGPIKEFKDRYYALIYLNNQTLLMVDEVK